MYCKTVILAVVCIAVLITADDDDRGGSDERRGEDGGGRGGGRGGKRGGGEGGEGRHKGGGPGCGFEKMKKCCPSLPEIIKKESVAECMPASPGGPPPRGPAPEGEGEKGPRGPPHGGFKNRSCMMECAFSANGFTTTGADGKVVLNMDALNAKLTSVAAGPWASVVAAAQANCTSAPQVADQTQTCTSGSGEVAQCLLRQMVPNCPDMVDSKECKKVVSRLVEDRHGPGGGPRGKRGDKKRGGRGGGGEEDGEGGRRGGGDEEGEEGGEGGRRGNRRGGGDGEGGRRGGRKGGRDGNNEGDRGRKDQNED